MSSQKNNKQMSYAIPKSYAIKHCRKRPKKGRGVAMIFSQYFTNVIAFGYFCIEKLFGIKKTWPQKSNKRMSYAMPKFNPIKHRRKWPKNGRGVAMAISQYFTIVIACWYFRIERSCGIKKKRYPTRAINEWVMLYQNLTQSNTVEKDQKIGEVLQRPFLNTSRLLILLDTFTSTNIAE